LLQAESSVSHHFCLIAQIQGVFIVSFYEKFYKLCRENGTRPSPECIRLGLSKSAATRWKNGATPDGDTVIKICQYFDVPEYERLTRVFNYPEQPRIWREADIPRYGVKSYFFSNVCAAYRRDAYLAAGGFDAPILTNEDMMIAA
jgi:transcriptional regulator with XRE-family HTH domain